MSRSFTWLLKLKVMPVKAPVFTSNAARPRDSVTAPSAPERTPVKLPPTNMVEPTCSKVWTWILPSALEPLRLPVTPHWVGAANSETARVTVEAAAPSSGMRVKSEESEAIRGRR